MIENGHIVRFFARNSYETENTASEVQQHVQLYAPLAATESCQREHTQTEVDRHTVESTDGLVQFHEDALVEIEFSRPTDQRLSKVGEDASIVCAVRIGQRIPRNLSPE